MDCFRIAVAYSSKKGLEKEFARHSERTPKGDLPPADFFAEGDSSETINALLDALRSKGHKVEGFEADDSIADKLRQYSPDIVFNIAEGLFGDFRESFVPAICERLGIPCTGSGPLTLALCLNKARAKEVLTFHSVPNPAFRVFSEGDEVDLKGFEFPVIVKPVAEGSSKGIFNDSVADNAATAEWLVNDRLQKYGQKVIVEQFIDGDEFTVAVWGNGSEIETLPIVRINYDDLPAEARKIYSYEAKWVWDTPDKPLKIFECPAKISNALEKSIEETVKKAYNAMDVKDWCRIDVRLDSKGVPNVLELNPLPGILPNPEDNSCFPKAARSAGYDYADMLNRVVNIAAMRYKLISRAYEREPESSCCLQ